MKQLSKTFVIALAFALTVGIVPPASSASPQFESPVQSLESSQLKHIGKFDGDSVPDLLLVFQNKISYRKGLGNGGFGSPIGSTLEVQIFNSTYTAIGDLTGDSIEDFVFVVPFGKHLEIYKGSIEGTFSLYRSIELDYSINKPIIGNFNADSYPDVLITSTSNWGGNYFLEGTASGISVTKTEYKEGFYPNGFRCDVSRIANISATGSPAFLCLGSISIGIIPMNSATQPGTINGYSSLYTSYPDERQYAIADFTGDGLQDLAALRGNSSSLSLLIYENSSLGLNSPKTMSLGNVSWLDQLLTSDVDADGRSDLVLFKPNGQTLYSLNLGGMKFQLFQPLPANLSNEYLTIKDLNGDNIGDFIFSGNNRISVALTKNVTKQEAEAKAAAELKAKQEAAVKAAAELKAKQEAEAKAKAAAELKAKQEAEAKAAAELKAKQEAEAKAAAELKAKQEAEAKAAAELKAKQEAEAKAAAELKAKQEAEAKAAAELKAKQEAEAKAAAELKAKQEAEAKAAAEVKAKQEAEAKAAAELKAKQEAEAKAAAELKAKQEAEAKAAAELKAAGEKIISDAKAEAARILAAAKAAASKKKITITCIKGKLVKKVTAVKPVCPAGYKKKA